MNKGWLAVILVIVYGLVGAYILGLPPFQTAEIYTGTLIMSLTLFILLIHGKMIKISIPFLIISLILIVVLLPNIKDIPIYFSKNYSTVYVKVEKYYYKGEFKDTRGDEYIVGKANGLGEKITFRLPTNWWRDTNGSSDEMEGIEYKVIYLPNTKQIINLEEKKQTVPEKSTNENE